VADRNIIIYTQSDSMFCGKVKETLSLDRRRFTLVEKTLKPHAYSFVLLRCTFYDAE
jgi:hypothetical protein